MAVDIPSQQEIAFEIEMANRDDKRNFVFCPLTNSMCRTDCEAYRHPWVFANHHVEGGFCNAAILKGNVIRGDDS